MLPIPPELRDAYDHELKVRDVPVGHQPHYRKWLRFYLDYCEKYRQRFRERASLAGFLRKLEAKGQAEWMRAQANEAVRLYYDLVERRRRTQVSWPAATPIGEDWAPTTRPPIQTQRPQGSSSEGLGHSPEPVPPSLVINPAGAGRPPARREAASVDSGEGAHPASPPAPAADSPGNWPDLYRRISDAIKVRHYSEKTLKSYTIWTRTFQGFVHGRPPSSVTVEDVKAFLTHLAVDRKVSASSQNLAFNALLFVFRHGLGKEFGRIDGVVRAKRRPYVPVVLSRAEVDRLIAGLAPPCDLAAKLLYGCGLRLFECLKLRVQEVDFDMGVLTVHDGKGQKDRTLPLPEALPPELRAQLREVVRRHQADVAGGYAGTFLPTRLEDKYKSAATELAWQWFFPATNLTAVPGSAERRRYHLHETVMQKAIKKAVRQAGIPKRASAHTLRHRYASHLLQANYDIRTIQELLGHASVKTMIYTHTLRSRSVKEARSPLDF